MFKKQMYLITHGEKFNDSPDPGMTELGKQQVARLLPQLEIMTDGKSGEVHVGTGRRHVEILAVMGIDPDTAFLSEIWGSPASKVDSEGDVVQLACGMQVPLKNFLGSRHLAGAIREVLASLPDGSVIFSGRPTLVKFDPDADKSIMKSGALYIIHVYQFSSDDVDAGLAPDSELHIEVELNVDGVVLADKGTGAAV